MQLSGLFDAFTFTAFLATLRKAASGSLSPSDGADPSQVPTQPSTQQGGQGQKARGKAAKGNSQAGAGRAKGRTATAKGGASKGAALSGHSDEDDMEDGAEYDDQTRGEGRRGAAGGRGGGGGAGDVNGLAVCVQALCDLTAFLQVRCIGGMGHSNRSRFD